MKIELELSESEARALATWLDEGGSLDDDLALDAAHQINAQIPTPRIPEPALYGVVSAHLSPESSSLFLFIRVHGAGARDAYHWICEEDGSIHTWGDLIDPTLIREGI